MSTETRAIYDPGALASVKVRALRLRVVEGPDAGMSFEIRRRTIALGSDPDGDVPLSDATVSRRHAVLEQTDDGLRVRDLESTNGTFVNGVRVQSAWFPGSGVLRLGETRMEVDAEGEAVEVDVYRGDHLAGLVGRSEAMQELFGLIARVAPTHATVLVVGESGTGKELVAEGIHQLSKCAGGPFVVFDCGAVPEDLIESELFGHVKGAFTGAGSARSGAFRQAHGGTLFLDEIGELSPKTQPKLLRALESREIKPVGGERVERVDVRIVAATNRPLRAMVREGSFREDLYFRLAHMEIDLPPLREHADDVPLLIEHFLASIDSDRPLQIGYSTMRRLMAHTWPGNVRELKNYVERAALLSEGDRLETRFIVPRDAPEPESAEDGGAVARDPSGAGPDLAVHYALPFKDAKARLVEAFEKAYWSRMLEEHGWNVSAAARAAGIHRKSLEYVVRKLGLRA